MAILKMSKIKTMDKKELESKRDELKLELSKEMGKIKVGGFPENPGKLREIRKTIARINTRLNEKKEVKKK